MRFKKDSSFDIDLDYYILDTCNNWEFRALTEQYFSEHNLGLRFCLLEMVLLKERGIGETHIFGRRKRDFSQFYKKYYDLVAKFKKEFNGGVSSYNEWYSSRDLWYLIENTDQESERYERANYNWHPYEIDEREIKKYGDKDSGLTDSFIKNYLNNYAKEFASLELNKYPSYGIVIKPLGYYDKNSEIITPLGNLYLHFGANKKLEKDLLLKYMKDFQLLWYKNYGGILVEETKRRLLEQLSSIRPSLGYLPDFSHMHADAKNYLSKERGPTNFTIEAYYEKLFIERREQFEGNLTILKNFIPKLKNFIDNGSNSATFSLRPLADQLSISNSLHRHSGVTKLKSKKSYNEGLNDFEIILIRRELFKIGFLLLDINKIKMRDLLMNGEINNSTDYYKKEKNYHMYADAAYAYLWSGLFIPWEKRAAPSVTNEQRKKKIRGSLSNFEKNFLDDCKEYINQFE